MIIREEKKKRAYRLAAAALIILGCCLRLAFIGSLPLGLNQDEASAAYDAWAILHYGIDRCGNALPVLLESWGSGQNALMSYLSMPFIALFGLTPFSARIVPALAGCCSLAAFWLLACRIRGQRFGLAALFLLCLCPWHIMASRWALESNLLPAALLFGVWMTVRAREKPWSLLPAGISFGLALYAYGTAYFFLPPFLIFAVIWLRGRLRPASFIVSLCVFLLIALPISLCQLRNVLGLPAAEFLGFSLPELTETRQAATSILGGGGAQVAWDNFRQLMRLLLTQSDGLKFNSLGLGNGGLFYFFGLPLAAVGVSCSVSGMKRHPEEAPMLAWLLCAILAALFIDVNVNRINMLWLPLIYFASLGLYYVLCLLDRWYFAALPVVIICFLLFINSYVNTFGGDGDTNYFPGLGECIEYVEQREPESVFISSYVNQPYVLTLFYTETPPQKFIDTVDYVNPTGAFRAVSSFGHYRFGSASAATGEYLILHVSEARGRNTLASYGQFVVCDGKA